MSVALDNFGISVLCVPLDNGVTPVLCVSVDNEVISVLCVELLWCALSPASCEYELLHTTHL